MSGHPRHGEPGSLRGLAAVVTGAGSGIGRGIAQELARRHAAICVLDVDAAAAERSAAELSDTGAQAVGFGADVTDEGQIAGAIASLIDEGGTIDVVVNCAGIDTHGAVESLTPQQFRRVLDVNVTGAYVVTRTCLPHLTAAGGGSIVMIGSVMGTYSAPGYSAYSASKSALVGMTKSLAIELGPRGIRVNCVAPGYIDTAMWDQVIAARPDGEAFAEGIRAAHPVGRRGRPQDIADAVAFLAGDASAFITGQELTVDGGVTSALMRTTAKSAKSSG